MRVPRHRPRGRGRLPGQCERRGRPFARRYRPRAHPDRNLGRPHRRAQLPHDRGRRRLGAVHPHDREHPVGKSQNRPHHGALGPGSSAQTACPAAGGDMISRVQCPLRGQRSCPLRDRPPILDYGERNPNDWGAGSALFDAKGSFFDEIGIFLVRKCKKTGSWANESTVFARASGCNGRFWAMIRYPFGAGLRRSAGGARVRGGRARRLITDR